MLEKLLYKNIIHQETEKMLHDVTEKTRDGLGKRTRLSLPAALPPASARWARSLCSHGAGLTHGNVTMCFSATNLLAR